MYEQKVTFHTAAAATANGTLFPCSGYATVLAQISGTFVATVTWEGTVDNTNYVAIQAVNLNTGALATTATAAGLYAIPVSGLRLFRARMTWTSGTSITVSGIGTDAPYAMLHDLAVASVASITAVPSAIQGPGNPTVDSYNTVKIDLAASSADQVLVAAPAAGKAIWVYGLFMMADTAAGTVVLQDSDDAALTGTMAVSDEGGWVLPLSGNFAMPWIKCTTAKALEADTGACTIDGLLCYGVITV